MNRITTRRFLCFIMCICLCVVLCSCKSSPTTEMGKVDLSISRCWPCVIYGIVFEFIDKLVKNSVRTACSFGLVIVALGGVFTILFKVGRMLMPFTFDKDKKGQLVDHNPANDLYSLIPIGLKAIFVSAALWRSGDLLDLFSLLYDTVGSWFISLANGVLTSVSGLEKYFPKVAGIDPGFWNRNPLTTGVIVDFQGKMSVISVSQSVFGTLGLQVQYIVSRVYGTLSNMMPLAANLMTEGGLLSWILALYTMYQVVVLTLIFPLVFVDSFIQLVFIMSIFPILLALWVFPATEKYLKQFIPKSFIAPFVHIIFGTIFLVVMMTVLGVYSDIYLGSMLNYKSGAFDATVAENARLGKPDILIMIILLIAIRRLAENIGDFTDQILGSNVGGGGSLWKFVKQMEKLAKSAIKGGVRITAALAIGGAGAGFAAVAKSGAAATAAEAARSASGRGSSGGTP